VRRVVVTVLAVATVAVGVVVGLALFRTPVPSGLPTLSPIEVSAPPGVPRTAPPPVTPDVSGFVPPPPADDDDDDRDDQDDGDDDADDDDDG
jgi:hypothetical protein